MVDEYRTNKATDGFLHELLKSRTKMTRNPTATEIATFGAYIPKWAAPQRGGYTVTITITRRGASSPVETGRWGTSGVYDLHASPSREDS